MVCHPVLTPEVAEAISEALNNLIADVFALFVIVTIFGSPAVAVKGYLPRKFPESPIFIS